jgi:hypothetical protein
MILFRSILRGSLIVITGAGSGAFVSIIHLLDNALYSLLVGRGFLRRIDLL